MSCSLNGSINYDIKDIHTNEDHTNYDFTRDDTDIDNIELSHDTNLADLFEDHFRDVTVDLCHSI